MTILLDMTLMGNPWNSCSTREKLLCNLVQTSPIVQRFCSALFGGGFCASSDESRHARRPETCGAAIAFCQLRHVSLNNSDIPKDVPDSSFVDPIIGISSPGAYAITPGGV